MRALVVVACAFFLLGCSDLWATDDRPLQDVQTSEDVGAPAMHVSANAEARFAAVCGAEAKARADDAGYGNFGSDEDSRQQLFKMVYDECMDWNMKHSL